MPQAQQKKRDVTSKVKPVNTAVTVREGLRLREAVASDPPQFYTLRITQPPKQRHATMTAAATTTTMNCDAETGGEVSRDRVYSRNDSNPLPFFLTDRANRSHARLLARLHSSLRGREANAADCLLSLFLPPCSPLSDFYPISTSLVLSYF